MPIFEHIPNAWFPCNDGTYTTTNSRGACNWHGGLKSSQPVSVTNAGENQAEIFLIPLTKILTAHELFQNRVAPFSARSVENIINAVTGGTFIWANLDPVTVWKNPQDQKLYILSGHSRFEAFTRLCEMQLQVDGKDFCSIPAKIVSTDIDTARQIALESNTLSTKETEVERSNYYRKLREQGESMTSIRDRAKRLEGRNNKTILALSFLNPTGKFFQDLEAFQGSDTTSAKNIMDAARWTGNARMSNPQLSDYHENEIYDWLIKNIWYNKLGSENKFREQLGSIINKRTTFGQLDESLNFNSFYSRSPIEMAFDAQLQEAKEKVNDLDKQVKQKIADLTKRGATSEQVNDIIQPLEAALRRARIDYTNLMNKRGEVSQAAKNELSLFDGIGGLPKFTHGDMVQVNCSNLPFCYHLGIVTNENGRLYVYHNTPTLQNSYGGNIIRQPIEDFLKGRAYIGKKNIPVDMQHLKRYIWNNRQRKWHLGQFNCIRFVDEILKFKR